MLDHEADAVKVMFVNSDAFTQFHNDYTCRVNVEKLHIISLHTPCICSLLFQVLAAG